MQQTLKLQGYFAGALFSAQELYGNRMLAEEIASVSQDTLHIVLPQDVSAQETGDGRGTRATDYLTMLQCDFVLANMNGPELDSGTVAEFVVASMLGMPRVQFRSDFRNVGDVFSSFPDLITVKQTDVVPYNLMLGHDASALVFINSMAIYKASKTPAAFLNTLAVAALQGIQIAYQQNTAGPEEYASYLTALDRYLRLDATVVAELLKKKSDRHRSDRYREAVARLQGMAVQKN